MQARAEVVTPQIFLFEVKLSEGMSSVNDRFDSFCAGHLADSLHRRNLPGDIYLVGHKNKPRATRDASFKRGGYLVQVLWRNRNLDQLECQTFALLALAQRRQHPRVVLGGGKNLIA